VLSLY